MNLGDKIRINNEAGTMEISIWEKLLNSQIKYGGLQFENDCKVRFECHSRECGKLLVTIYEDVEDNRVVYIIEYDGETVSYYVGRIEMFEHENILTYKTI